MNLNNLQADFRNLDPKQIGSWPMAPKAATLVGCFTAIVATGWFALGQPILDDISRAQADLEKNKAEFLEKKSQAINLDFHKQQLVEIDKSFGQLLRQLPSKAEVDNLLIEVNQAGLGRGLQFELFKPGAEAVKDFYAELPVTIKVKGDYNALGFFAEDVGKLSRVITLGNMAIVAEPRDPKEVKEVKKDTPMGKLSMEATMKTFRYLDEAEVADQKKKAADAAKAKNGKGKSK